MAVLRVRGRALAVALLPAATAVILVAGGTSGHLVGRGWDIARWVVSGLALLVLFAAAGVALVVARARPAVSPTVPISEESAPDLYRMVRDLADRLDVPAPSAIALTPDCDSWLEDRTHPPHGPPAGKPHADQGEEGRDVAAPGRSRPHRRTAATVLVIGSPFLWWMRVGELRAVLAPVVAGTGPSAHPDIAAARRFVRGLDAAVAVAATPGRCPLTRTVCAALGWVARLLLRGWREHAAEMERGVAAAAAERAKTVDYGLRIVAQEQVGLAYAGWDRLLTRVALPAWRMGRWPARLDAGVVAALTELSRRDRLAEGFTSRLGERPACDLLEEPGLVDEAASLLAARLFHGGPAEAGPDWSPVDWDDYPEEVVDRKWRSDAARLHRVLDTLGTPIPADPGRDSIADRASDAGHRAVRQAPADAVRHLAADAAHDPVPHAAAPDAVQGSAPDTAPEAVPRPAPAPPAGNPADHADPADPTPDPPPDPSGPTLARVLAHLAGPPVPSAGNPRAAALAECLSAELAREEAAAPASRGDLVTGSELWDDKALPLFPLQPPRTPREILADHVTAMVCCAAMDTAGATPGLDWLDGPTLLIDGERAADLTPRVLSLTEDGDPSPLREWLTASGIRPEKPVRLV
jgi:hypothetical protein